MARQDFERFKQEIKEWLDGHPEEYDRFVAEVNDKSAIGLYLSLIHISEPTRR